MKVAWEPCSWLASDVGQSWGAEPSSVGAVLTLSR